MKLTGNKCQCGACSLYFRSVSAFDRHRVGPHSNRRCLDITQMSSKGMVCDERGFWKSGHNPLYRKEWVRV